MKEKTMSPMDFIISELVTGHDDPLLTCSSYPVDVVYDLMRKYSDYIQLEKQSQAKNNPFKC